MLHVDWDLITGTRISNNIHCIQAQWSRSDLPLDVFAVTGLSNLLDGDSVDYIMDEFQRLKDLIVSICPAHPTGSSNHPDAAQDHLLRHMRQGTHRAEYLKELNRRITDFNKKREVDSEGTILIPKYDTSIAPALFHQARIEFF